jgi:hypothetical protein
LLAAKESQGFWEFPVGGCTQNRLGSWSWAVCFQGGHLAALSLFLCLRMGTALRLSGPQERHELLSLNFPAVCGMAVPLQEVRMETWQKCALLLAKSQGRGQRGTGRLSLPSC